MKRSPNGQAPVTKSGIYQARVRDPLSRRKIYDGRLSRDILKAERQIRRGEVVPWSEAKRRLGV